MPVGTKVPCPKCGTPMNRHAEKVDYGFAAPTRDRALGGTVTEFHTCPNPSCRFVLERPAPEN